MSYTLLYQCGLRVAWSLSQFDPARRRLAILNARAGISELRVLAVLDPSPQKPDKQLIRWLAILLDNGQPRRENHVNG